MFSSFSNGEEWCPEAVSPKLTHFLQEGDGGSWATRGKQKVTWLGDHNLKSFEGSSPVIWNRLKTCWGGEPGQRSHRVERYRECRVVCKLGRDGRRIGASVSLNQGCGAGVAVLGWAFHHCTCFCVIPVPVSLCKSLTHTPVTVPTKNQVAH